MTECPACGGRGPWRRHVDHADWCPRYRAGTAQPRQDSHEQATTAAVAAPAA